MDSIIPWKPAGFLDAVWLLGITAYFDHCLIHRQLVGLLYWAHPTLRSQRQRQ